MIQYNITIRGTGPNDGRVGQSVALRARRQQSSLFPKYLVNHGDRFEVNPESWTQLKGSR